MRSVRWFAEYVLQLVCEAETRVIFGRQMLLLLLVPNCDSPPRRIESHILYLMTSDNLLGRRSRNNDVYFISRPLLCRSVVADSPGKWIDGCRQEKDKRTSGRSVDRSYSCHSGSLDRDLSLPMRKSHHNDRDGGGLPLHKWLPLERFLLFGAMSLSLGTALSESSFSTTRVPLRFQLTKKQQPPPPPTPPGQEPQQAPLLVVLPGTAQSMSLYQQHVPRLSQQHTVLLVEAAGLGPLPDDPTLWDDVSLPKQAERLIETIDSLWQKEDHDRRGKEPTLASQPKVNLVGFSLGARIALATACLYPDRIHKLHVTGVSKTFSETALATYFAWQQLLSQDNLTGFAWTALLSSYSPSFLCRYQDKLPDSIRALTQYHTSQGLLALITQSRSDPEWSVERMIPKLLLFLSSSSSSSSSSSFGPIDTATSRHIHLCVGQDDLIAVPHSVHELARDLQCNLSIVPDCGHSVPLEAPKLWRDNVLDFLDDY